MLDNRKKIDRAGELLNAAERKALDATQRWAAPPVRYHSQRPDTQLPASDCVLDVREPTKVVQE